MALETLKNVTKRAAEEWALDHSEAMNKDNRPLYENLEEAYLAGWAARAALDEVHAKEGEKCGETYLDIRNVDHLRDTIAKGKARKG